MNTILDTPASKAQQALNFIWLLLTSLFIIIVVYYQWQQQILQKQQQHLNVLAQQVGDKIDNLLDTLQKSAETLPLYGQKLPNCQYQLRSILDSIAFNNPEISGAVVSDKDHKVICSTLNNDYTLPSPDLKSPSFFGPFPLGVTNKEAFLFQQRLGPYYFGVYVIKDVIINLLKSISPEITYVGIYNNKTKKIILAVGESPLLPSIGINSVGLAKTGIRELNDYIVIIAAKPTNLNKQFLLQQASLILAILFISLLLYFLLRSLLNKHFSLNNALVHGLKAGQFYPMYQPIRDIKQQKYSGAEVLLRWSKSTNEIIMPNTFIDEAEQSGLIVPITRQLLEKAFQQCFPLLQLYPDFHLSFNFSAKHFNDVNFIRQFYELCINYKIPAKQIMIELTERELLNHNDPELIAKIKELQVKGYALAIDDFGTGNASINYLQHFHFNYLKIDKLFIHAIGTGAITASLNQAIIQMANCLQLKIIAEGVETKEQLDFLQQAQVELIQGWYFAKAMSYEELLETIKKD